MDLTGKMSQWIISAMIMVILYVSMVAMWKGRHRRRHISSLQGKHVMITGGSSGIGLAIAKKCFSEGAYLTLLARNESRLSHAASLLVSSHQSAHMLRDRILLKAVDVSDPSAVAAAIAQSIAWKPIDVLICNAGIVIHGSFDDVKVKELQRVASTNVLGCAFPIHAALSHMKSRSSQNPSSIVLMSSLSSLMFVPGANMYTSSKYAVNGLAEALRFEVMPYNIKVNLVCPGFTETPMLDEADKAANEVAGVYGNPTFYDRANAQSPEDVAAMTVEGVKRGEYLITTTAVGFFLSVLGRGFVPADSFARAFLELLLLVPVRLGSFVWLAYATSRIKKF
ncbi:hypothetical protein KP509_04G037600 [Ceratopteris richardii]|uniref:Uncharacterized protein n=1 Tax=Ceratopteris richardii TaxID=49495 RepID=A0A8T2UZ31_CERRI|nr:hypothetical protein KP509_04G037600 [Ceratopteris richardii]